MNARNHTRGPGAPATDSDDARRRQGPDAFEVFYDRHGGARTPRAPDRRRSRGREDVTQRRSVDLAQQGPLRRGAAGASVPGRSESSGTGRSTHCDAIGPAPKLDLGDEAAIETAAGRRAHRDRGDSREAGAPAPGTRSCHASSRSDRAGLIRGFSHSEIAEMVGAPTRHYQGEDAARPREDQGHTGRGHPRRTSPAPTCDLASRQALYALSATRDDSRRTRWRAARRRRRRVETHLEGCEACRDRLRGCSPPSTCCRARLSRWSRRRSCGRDCSPPSSPSGQGLRPARDVRRGPPAASGRAPVAPGDRRRRGAILIAGVAGGYLLHQPASRSSVVAVRPSSSGPAVTGTSSARRLGDPPRGLTLPSLPRGMCTRYGWSANGATEPASLFEPSATGRRRQPSRPARGRRRGPGHEGASRRQRAADVAASCAPTSTSNEQAPVHSSRRGRLLPPSQSRNQCLVLHAGAASPIACRDTSHGCPECARQRPGAPHRPADGGTAPANRTS